MDDETREVLTAITNQLDTIQNMLTTMLPMIEKAAEIGSVFEDFGKSMGVGGNSGTSSPVGVHMVGSQAPSLTTQPPTGTTYTAPAN